MKENKPFFELFSIYFFVITIVSVIIFIFIGLKITDKFFSYYVDSVHAETQQMLLTKIGMHYMMYNTWDNYSDEETGKSAKLSGDYFTLKHNDGSVIYSNEYDIQMCCANQNHVYMNHDLPIIVNGAPVGILNVGYFANHITSPEGEAFRKSGVFLIILSIFVISLMGAIISLLFFYRLSKPIKIIAAVADNISKGELDSRVEIKSNVFEMNRIALAINRLGDSLLKQEKYRHELTTELSHELRTPLQILLSHMEAIIDGIYLPDQQRMEAMHAELIRITNLLDELENRLISEDDSFTIITTPTNISNITKQIVTGYEGSFIKKGLMLKYDLDENVVRKVDKVRYSQVLINLLSNALKFTETGNVIVSLKHDNDIAVLQIADTGIGIHKAHLSDIFKRFYHSHGDITSRGVGLYLVKLIADQHGWEIDVKSRKNNGTIFEIKIKN